MPTNKILTEKREILIPESSCDTCAFWTVTVPAPQVHTFKCAIYDHKVRRHVLDIRTTPKPEMCKAVRVLIYEKYFDVAQMG